MIKKIGYLRELVIFNFCSQSSWNAMEYANFNLNLTIATTYEPAGWDNDEGTDDDCSIRSALMCALFGRA